MNNYMIINEENTTLSKHYIYQIDSFLKNIDLTSINDINEILQLYNISKYIKDGLYEPNDINLMQKIKSVSLSFRNENYLDEYENVEVELDYSFWQLFIQLKIYTFYSDDTFKSFLDKSSICLDYLLSNKVLVKHYESIIKEYILSNSENVEDIFDCLVVDNKYKIKRKIYLPISSLEIEELIIDYINSESPNLNYLKLIMTNKNREILKVSDKTKRLAKNKIDDLYAEYFPNDGGISTQIEIKFDPNQDKAYLITNKRGILVYSYSTKWILGNLTNETILNNFIYLFEFVDNQMRATFLSKKNDNQGLMAEIGLKSKLNYDDENMMFRCFEGKTLNTLNLYIQILKNNKILIEDVLSWFFSSYLKEHFHIDDFNINMPSENNSYLEKCIIIAPVIESVIKKFNIYIEEGFIDNELLEMSSTPLQFSKCKSKHNIKYVYPIFEDFNVACHYLFSNQSMLQYDKKEKKSYSSFYSLIMTKNIYFSDYHDYFKEKINWLIKNNYVYLDQNGRILIKDLMLVNILHDLYRNEVINFINLSKNEKKYVIKMIEDKKLRSENTLFSIPEQNYLNYYLNNSMYGNSLGLRNKYAHGTQSQTEKNSSIHYTNYLNFLKILIFIVIKINDELCG